jgi:hypothetical protein
MNIIIIAVPRSYTSVTTKYYLDKGFNLSSKKEIKTPYETFEVNFDCNKPEDRVKFIEEFNQNDNCVFKVTELSPYLDEVLPKLTGQFKIIFVIRNPIDMINSSLEKNNNNSSMGRTAHYFLLRFCHVYEQVLNAKLSGYDVEIVMGETFVPNRKLRKTNWKLNRRLLKLMQLIFKEDKISKEDED